MLLSYNEVEPSTRELYYQHVQRHVPFSLYLQDSEIC